MTARASGVYILLSAFLASTSCYAAGLDLAVAKSKDSGLPLLVIGSGENCAYCVELEKRLSTEPDLQPLVAQYVPVKLMVDEPDFAAFAQTYKPTGEGIPMIFIISSDGKEIANVSGLPAGDGLKQLLERGIAETGGIKNVASDAGAGMKAERALRIVKRLLARDQKDDAIVVLAPFIEKNQTAQPSDAAARGDKRSELLQMAADLTREARAEFDKAVAKSKTQGGALLGAVMQARVRRIYGGLPDIASALDAFEAEFEADAERAPLIAQAALIDKAREFDERKNKTRAVAAYRKVMEQFPDTEAARLSEIRVGQLEK
jgi:tetratricopeptide (TPR) repeat protein